MVCSYIIFYCLFQLLLTIPLGQTQTGNSWHQRVTASTCPVVLAQHGMMLTPLYIHSSLNLQVLMRLARRCRSIFSRPEKFAIDGSSYYFHAMLKTLVVCTGDWVVGYLMMPQFQKFCIIRWIARTIMNDERNRVIEGWSTYNPLKCVIPPLAYRDQWK